MAFHYDKTTALEPAPGKKDTFHHTFHASWLNEGGGPLGSVIIAVVLKAILHVTKPLGFPDPVTLYSTFLASPSAGQRCEIRVEILKRGRQFCFAEGRLFIPGRKDPAELELAFTAQGSFGTLSSDARQPIFSPGPIALPYYKLQPYPTATGKSPSESVDVFSVVDELLIAPYLENLSMLVDKAAVEDVVRQTEAQMKAGFAPDMMAASYGDLWMGDRDRRPPDYEALAIYSDVAPTFNAKMHNLYADNEPHMMSTVAEAIHFLAPIPEDNGPFVRVRANYTVCSRDLVEYETAIWDRQGNPIALARQVGLLRKLDNAKEGSVAAAVGKKAKM
ncbi:thioesterase-like superfamily-domain-containing protein [Hyaloraphidium curvatum]|nr:thioesterase-like superfamily-domain-containing protein [Hyaloraphidium curvatum]